MKKRIFLLAVCLGQIFLTINLVWAETSSNNTSVNATVPQQGAVIPLPPPPPPPPEPPPPPAPIITNISPPMGVVGEPGEIIVLQGSNFLPNSRVILGLTTAPVVVEKITFRKNGVEQCPTNCQIYPNPTTVGAGRYIIDCDARAPGGDYRSCSENPPFEPITVTRTPTTRQRISRIYSGQPENWGLVGCQWSAAVKTISCQSFEFAHNFNALNLNLAPAPRYLATTFVNSERLMAVIPASELQTPRQVGVTVENPAPQGETILSNTINYPIDYPTAVLASLSPAQVTEGRPGLILTIQGKIFYPGSVVTFDLFDLPTTVDGFQQITATIPASDLVRVGVHNITVRNPCANRWCPSNGLAFEVTAAPAPPACTAWTCSAWSACSAQGRQTRACTASPANCSGGVVRPPLSQTCTAPIVQPPTLPPDVLPPEVLPPEPPPPTPPTEEVIPPEEALPPEELPPAEELVPPPTPPTFDLSDLTIASTVGPIDITPEGLLPVFTGQEITVSVDPASLPQPAVEITVSIEETSFPLPLQEDNLFRNEITAPAAPGVFPATLTINFQDGTSEDLNFFINSLPPGSVFTIEEGVSTPVSQARIELFAQNPDGSFSLWTSPFSPNPQVTNETGAFGWYVPAGTYSLKVSRPGFSQFETNPFKITQPALINNQIDLVKQPPPFTVDFQAPLVENLVNIAKVLRQQAFYGSRVSARKIKKVVTNPEVKRVSEQVLAPTTAALTVVNVSVATTAAIGGTAQVIPYLHFLFSQPFLALFRRKRQNWGVVYNSLTKKPVELATVRLIEAKTNKLEQTRVTDRFGRYAFFPPAGVYRLQISAPELIYPTSFFAALKDDGAFLDLYHGEEINVAAKGAVVTANVPLDPLGQEKPIAKIVLALTLRKIQAAAGVSTVFLSLASALINPSPLTGSLLAGQVALYGLTRRFIYPTKPKKWGTISNSKNRQPLNQAVARIFDREYNKLLETQLTDKQGRYGFLVGANDYYLIFEKPGFERKQSEIISLKNIKTSVDIIGLNTELEPLSS